MRKDTRKRSKVIVIQSVCSSSLYTIKEHTNYVITTISTLQSIFYFISQWMPEIRAKLPNVPLILIGTQVDQRNKPHVVDALVDKDTPPIEFEQGEKLADNIGAVCYMECSALCPNDIDKVRQVTASIANEHKQKHKGKKCLIL